MDAQRATSALLDIALVMLALTAGARVLLTLRGGSSNGVLVPNGALLYGEQGAYVYRRLDTHDKDGKQQYAPVAVKLLQAAGTAWLGSPDLS